MYPANCEFDSCDRRYLTESMINQLRNATYISNSSVNGRGLFARTDLNRGVVVGYFSGRVLNSRTHGEANSHFIASGRWIHPISGKRYSYHFEVMSPSRLMNAGINPSYLNGPSHLMVANVMLVPAVFKVNNRHRIGYRLKTLRAVKEHEELLLDYGILYDTIYYEFLRRSAMRDAKPAQHAFYEFINQQHQHWMVHTGRKPRSTVETDEKFLEMFARAYFNGTT